MKPANFPGRKWLRQERANRRVPLAEILAGTDRTNAYGELEVPTGIRQHKSKKRREARKGTNS